MGAFRPFAETQSAMARLEDTMLGELQQNIDQALLGTFPSLHGLASGSKRPAPTSTPPRDSKKPKLGSSTPHRSSSEYSSTQELQIRQLGIELSSAQRELGQCQ